MRKLLLLSLSLLNNRGMNGLTGLSNLVKAQQRPGISRAATHMIGGTP